MCLCKSSISCDWKTDFISSGSSPCPPSLQTFTKAPSGGIIEGQGVRVFIHPKRGMPEEPSLVDRPTVHLERSMYNYTSPRYDNNHRCFVEVLGGGCHGRQTRRIWTEEESNSHHINALELKAALFSLRAFTPNQERLHVHLRMDNSTAVSRTDEISN
ncbi:hypothetical protein AC249_AIPGENE11840 [Exaiptasia diaphana]|nr:hypothetical protein AC249_AIPGENE11840 [Exaiptasia diaphana]